MLIALCLLLMGEPALSTKQMNKRIDALLAAPDMLDGFWGVMVYAPMRDKYLYLRNENRYFRTASNLKILTSMLAFEYLGPDYRFETAFGYAGTLEDGVLQGDLVIRGGGDPSISGYDQDLPIEVVLEPIIREIQKAGVREIRGDLVGLLDFFDNRPIQYSWEWEDMGQYYGVPVSPLILNDGLVSLSFSVRANGETLLAISPQGQYGVAFTDQLTHHASEIEMKIDRDWGGNLFRVRGNLPACERKNWRFGVWDPAMQFLAVLRERLQDVGVKTGGLCRTTRIPVETRPLFTLQSEPLAQLNEIFMKKSRNHYGEAFLKTTARIVRGEGSFEQGTELAGELLKQVVPSISTPPSMMDGSGLSSRNYLSPLQITALLNHGLTAPYQEDWLSAFPAMGDEGTLEKRGGDRMNAGVVRAKTGTISKTKNLSGYAWTQDGELLVFSLLANNFNAPSREIVKTQDRICEVLVRLAPSRKVKRKLRDLKSSQGAIPLNP